MYTLVTFPEPVCDYVFTFVTYVCILLYADDIVLVAEKEINL